MARKKKALTTDQKIKQYKAKKRRLLALKIAIPIVLLLAAIPLSYFGYYYVVFDVMAARDSGSYQPNRTGYSRPLRLIQREEEEPWTCALAYYYNDRWNVVEDTDAIMDNIDNFIVYKSDNEWHEGRHEQLFIIQRGYMFHHVTLGDFALIDDRCFRDCKKTMTMEEFEAYVKEKGWQNVYIN